MPGEMDRQNLHHFFGGRLRHRIREVRVRIARMLELLDLIETLLVMPIPPLANEPN